MPASPRAGVVSHGSAREIWSIDGPQVAQRHRTVTRNWNGRRWPDEKVHRVDLAPEDITEARGVLVTTPLRTVLDEARALPFEWAVAVCDSAIHKGLVSRAELQRAASAVLGRGAAKVRRVVLFVDGRAESVLESLARIALVLAGFEPQVQVTIGSFRVDLVIGHVVIELDGFAYHSNRADYRRDRRRVNTLTALGYRVLRFSWEDVMGDPGYVVAKVREVIALGA